MTKNDFERLQRQCSETLADYLAAATKLCIMLGDCSEQRLTVEQRNTIASQRRLENELFAEYHKVRDRLLHAARVGFGSME